MTSTALTTLIAGRRRVGLLAVVGLSLACLLLAIVAIGQGAISIPPGRVAEILMARLTGDTTLLEGRDVLVVLNIRLPRVLLGLLVGAGLAVSGALMQGLFRNPLADPGLVGVSSGAALAAAATIVLGDRLPCRDHDEAALRGPSHGRLLRRAGRDAGALPHRHARRAHLGRHHASRRCRARSAGERADRPPRLHLAMTAQLRDLTFWSLGSLGGASWTKLSAVAPIILPMLLLMPLLARGLNGLMLGEAEAYHLGIPVQRIKALAILFVALAVGASVASAGLVGFVGIVVPHLIRLSVGPDHRLLLPLSALGGAMLLVGADIVARLIVAPAELPIGIVTATIGAPFFLWLLLRRSSVLDV